ncbi:ribonuclease HII [Candidatus Woesearchaeota archaeon]|nr:ribonuclease HII [Candidatus Woesearchaeota archaeon]
MVMVIAVIDEKKENELRKIGVKDSKLILPEKREYLFKKLKGIVDYEMIIVEPKEIDEALLSERLNLNWLEAEKASFLINKMFKKKSFDKVILDCPSTNIKSYTDYVEKNLELKTRKNIKVIAEHKADVNHIVVGAASIIAKVTRDREIEKIKKKIGKEIGSGYPADPKTKKFLKENYDKYPEIFRKTWDTYKKIVNDKKQRGLEEF